MIRLPEVEKQRLPMFRCALRMIIAMPMPTAESFCPSAVAESSSTLTPALVAPRVKPVWSKLVDEQRGSANRCEWACGQSWWMDRSAVQVLTIAIAQIERDTLTEHPQTDVNANPNMNTQSVAPYYQMLVGFETERH